MPTFHQDIQKLVRENSNYLAEIVTNEFSQVVVMNIEPESDIGEQVYEVDHVLAIVEGTAEVVLNRKHTLVEANSLVVVPAGTRHNCINTGSMPLKLCILFAPPTQPVGAQYPTKAESIAAEAAAEEAQAARTMSALSARSSGAEAIQEPANYAKIQRDLR